MEDKLNRMKSFLRIPLNQNEFKKFSYWLSFGIGLEFLSTFESFNKTFATFGEEAQKDYKHVLACLKSRKTEVESIDSDTDTDTDDMPKKKNSKPARPHTFELLFEKHPKIKDFFGQNFSKLSEIHMAYSSYKYRYTSFSVKPATPTITPKSGIPIQKTILKRTTPAKKPSLPRTTSVRNFRKKA